jgi:hypothetical protein
LSSLGFDIGCMRLHNPADLSSAKALTENQDRSARVQPRFDQETDSPRAVRTERLSDLSDLLEHPSREPDPDHGRAPGARSPALFASLWHDFRLTKIGGE